MAAPAVEKAAWRKLFHTLSTSWKPLIDSKLHLLFMVQYVSGIPCNRPRRLSQAYMFSVPLPTRAFLRY